MLLRIMLLTNIQISFNSRKHFQEFLKFQKHTIKNLPSPL